MSYTPTEWKTGDIITAEKLNKIELELNRKGFLVISDNTIETGLEIEDFIGKKLVYATKNENNEIWSYQIYSDIFEVNDSNRENGTDYGAGETIRIQLQNNMLLYYNPQTGSLREFDPS